MAGLVAAENVFPYGTQGPWRRVAKLVAPSSISPGLYDPKQLQTSWNKHVPVPHLGDRWPAPNEGDTWGNVNAQHHMLQNPDPNSYDLGRLEISSTLKVPVPLPRAPGSLSAELAELTGSAPNPAAPESSKDILEIGKLILSTTSDPVQKHFWESHINTLTKLRMIAIQRPSGLNQEESKVEKLVSDAMKAEAMNLTHPAHAQAYVAPAAPLSAADVEHAMSSAMVNAFKSRKRASDEPEEVKMHMGPIPEQDVIGPASDPSNVAKVIISLSAVSADISDQLDTMYPLGMTQDDAKMWREVMKTLGLPKRELRPFEPARVTAEPDKPVSVIYLKFLNNKKAAIALQYIREHGLKNTIASGALQALFKVSEKGQFLANPGFIPEYVA